VVVLFVSPHTLRPKTAASAAVHRKSNPVGRVSGARKPCRDTGLASASITLASTAKPSPLTRPASMQARTTAAAAVTRDGLWTRLYVRGLGPKQAAELAAREYDATHRPDWIKGRR
jgi:hypothetical protein